MSNGLIVPRHVAAARNRTQAPGLVSSTAPTLAEEIAAPIPEGVPRGIFFRVVVMPVGMRSASKGGVMLTASTEVAQSWNHGLGKVVSVGSMAFKGPTWDGCAADEIPRVGSIVLFNPKVPARLKRNGVLYMIMNDDTIQSVISPKDAEGYTFIDGIEV